MAVDADRVVAVVAELKSGTFQPGTGFLIDGRSVLTAEHCTRDKTTHEPAVRVTVVCQDGRESDAEIGPVSQSLDIALLALPGLRALAGRAPRFAGAVRSGRAHVVGSSVWLERRRLSPVGT